MVLSCDSNRADSDCRGATCKFPLAAPIVLTARQIPRAARVGSE